jgi:hypothetical protein
MFIFKKFCYVAALVLIGMLLSCGPGLAESAEEFLSGCNIVANSEVRNGTILIPRGSSAAHLCWGAFVVIGGLVTWVDSKTNERWFAACVPSPVSRPELIAVFVKYIEAHPNRRHDDFVSVVFEALRNAYPCVPAK